MLENKSDNFGFDAQTEEYVDMVAAGIIDPTKVVRIALQDAASVAALLITTEAMVAERPKKEAAPAMPRAAWAEWAAWTTEPIRIRTTLRSGPLTLPDFELFHIPPRPLLFLFPTVPSNGAVYPYHHGDDPSRDRRR